MTPGQTQALRAQLDEEAREFAELVGQDDETSGIPKPPKIEVSETSADPERIGLTFGGVSVTAEPAPVRPPGGDGPPPCIAWAPITYVRFEIFMPLASESGEESNAYWFVLGNWTGDNWSPNGPYPPGSFGTPYMHPYSFMGIYLDDFVHDPPNKSYMSCEYQTDTGDFFHFNSDTVYDGGLGWNTIELKINSTVSPALVEPFCNGNPLLGGEDPPGPNFLQCQFDLGIRRLLFGSVRGYYKSLLRLRNLRIGTAFGASDLFEFSAFSPPIVPPFDSTQQHGSIEHTLAIDSSSLYCRTIEGFSTETYGDGWAYAEKCVTGP